MKTYTSLVLCSAVLLASCSSVMSPKARPTVKGITLTAPHQVTLLLPLQGELQEKAGTIHDGFMAAYYQAPGQATINVVDTQKTANIKQDYEAAQQASFVVGPLAKTQVSELAHQTTHSVPTLALNYTDDKLPTQFFEFGLSPQDEVVQVAARAWRDGHHRALIVTAASAWGKKMNSTLVNKWRQQGGSIVANMLVSQQKNIIDQLQALVPGLGEKNQLKKPDFDVILLATDPLQARSIASMFRFYGLGNISIYGTASIYSGMPSPEDKDLEGVRFCDIPWVINPTPEMQQATEKLRALHPEANFDIRLYALGVDAYRLLYQLNNLQSGAVYHGVTGALSLDNQRVRRVLSCGQFVNGQIVPLS